MPAGTSEELSAPVPWAISPPVQPEVTAAVQVPPEPVTCSEPAEPVPSSTMPFAAPSLLMLAKVSPAAPMSV
ncbi:hypothetical protein ACT3J6_25105, partial [Mycobacterium tuberculosis]